MRESIGLCRGKREDNGEWVYGDLIHGKGEQKGHLFIWYETDTFPFVEEAEVIPETVGQYTGIPDKNGMRIFEGDIIRYNNEIFDIEYCEDFAAYTPKSPCNMRQAPPITSITTRNFEVIGNIHDNPELLEG